MRYSTTRNLVSISALVMALLAVTAGCDDEPPFDQRDAGVSDDVRVIGGDEDADADTGPDQVCEPGEVDSCVDDSETDAEICNAEGTAFETRPCDGTAVCRDGECVEVECLPGNRTCGDAETPQRCEPDGQGGYEYVDEQPCEGHDECIGGGCVDRCDLQAGGTSYIGCEYWAVEQANASVGEGVYDDPDDRPPFAVSLTNSESQLDAEVTIYGPDDELVYSVPERDVRALPSGLNPDETTTVYSETLDANGDRIGTPHAGPIDGLEVPPDATITLLLPNQPMPQDETTVTDHGYRIETTQPTVAYQYNPYCCNHSFSNDASLLLPTSGLGTDYMMVGHSEVEFEAEFGADPPPQGPTLTVVGREPATEVEVRLADHLGEDGDWEDPLYPIRDGDGIEGPDDDGIIEVTLDEYEVFNLEGGEADTAVDLTGTVVRADAPVAAFSGHICAQVPNWLAACDHIQSQLRPIDTWGAEHVAGPHKIRDQSNIGDPDSLEGTYWKFVAREDDTEIDVGISFAESDVLPASGLDVPHCSEDQFGYGQYDGLIELDRGEYCEFGTREMFHAESNKPFSLAGFMSGQASVTDVIGPGSHAGDPAMHIVPPARQFRDNYEFLIPPTYHVSYVSVITSPDQTVELNGETIDPTDHDHQVLDDGSVLVAHLQVQPGPHHIEADEPFGLVAYGYDDYVSYAYTGGMNLTKDTISTISGP